MKKLKNLGGDSASDILRPRSHPLDPFFEPESVALIGATENPGSVGRTVLWNLLSTPFGGTVYPVNPKRSSVLGIRAYPNVAAIPEQVDLAVITTPAGTVPGIIKQCADAGIKCAIVISAGFKELGPEGLALEQKVLEEARKGGIRIIGPNCLGLMNPLSGLNATFARGMALPGNVGFISQSGALCTAVLDWSLREQVGFSSFISIGSMADVGWGDLIDYLGNDPRTRSILIYMETIGDARSFLSAAREVALTKPIICIKPGRTEAAAKAAASHTGSLTGSDEVLEAAFLRSGVLRVNNISDLFYMAEVLAKQPRPAGPRLAIVTNAGGPAVLATDALVTGGADISHISAETMEELNKILPSAWSHGNPMDILGDAPPERYSKSLEIIAKDPNADGMLVILTPQAMTDPTKTAEHLKPYAKIEGKPVIASWMGGVDVAAGEEILNKAGIPTFPYPDTAARAFVYMWQYSKNLSGLYETSIGSSAGGADRANAAKLVEDVRKTGRTILTEFESKQLLSMYGIPTVETRIAPTEDEAVAHADSIGYPIVLKLYSETITHKTDVGGVQLNIRNAEGVRTSFRAIQQSVAEKVGAQHFQGVTVQPMVKLDGYEIILGSSADPQFGPVLLFGMGGQLVEVFKDRALGLPPLTTTLARRMMEQTKIYKALKGVRGRKPVDLAALEQMMVRFSELVAEQPWIKEIDINPMLASPERLVALDARVVVYPADMPEAKLPKLAIRPYPVQFVSDWKLKDGSEICIRPIRPEDEPLMVKFHETLSERTVYQRYLHMMKLSQRVAHERLTRICFIDYDREVALVAIHDGAIVGVARLKKTHGSSEAEFAVIISDDFQGKGLGTELVRRLIDFAREEGISKVTADILPDNLVMQRICDQLGFRAKRAADDPTVKVELDTAVTV
ncbi:MAG TPA: bifunctional acetate--CoA ligase family protein/GNAT family N-acetyltransferase [Bryobacteraceae bacterium]|nr:bifunctional acetate--CoA ligase family protein/GNAT family N-acetyltransferase [Bryobacteraceae bacterium]